MSAIRENWRVLVLVVVVLASLFALFSPSVGGATGADAPEAPGAADGPTNLRYGLDLSGGTRIRAPLIGVVAENVEVGNESTGEVSEAVAGQLPVASPADVNVYRTGPATATVDVTAENVTASAFDGALADAGYAHDDPSEGVAEPTRQEVVRVLSNKINEAGLSGGTVVIERTSTGQNFIVVEVPQENRQRVRDLIESRGQVEIQAYYPTGDESYDQPTVLVREDFRSIGIAQQGEGAEPPFVPVRVRDDAAPEFQSAMVETGIASQGGSDCTYRQRPNSTQPCLLVVVDGEVVNSFGMSPSLARSMNDGSWAEDGRFRLTTRNFSEARSVAINLRAGALPARLDLGPNGSGTSSYVAPTQGAEFRSNSLITGLLAVLAVSGVVFLRYRDVRVAAPMIVTALSEIVILLGLAAAIGYPLDLAVIGGFIAVIGTGVDDLIIIADEVMAEGDVNSRRVFRSRFRKAFWVIGAAAATTIVAMAPLAILPSLGDLKGFAIFTILGVIVGVLLTRPAYGDILRALVTDR